eukprot:GFYU01004933.1.p1 GENE.GFYU01004933.1~~GFYU01004933.1.p1  ORF type:complete len:304 (+),score=38.97 GFYU01004933.1:48-914(+)
MGQRVNVDDATDLPAVRRRRRPAAGDSHSDSDSDRLRDLNRRLSILERNDNRSPWRIHVVPLTISILAGLVIGSAYIIHDLARGKNEAWSVLHEARDVSKMCMKLMEGVGDRLVKLKDMSLHIEQARTEFTPEVAESLSQRISQCEKETDTIIAQQMELFAATVTALHDSQFHHYSTQHPQATEFVLPDKRTGLTGAQLSNPLIVLFREFMQKKDMDTVTQISQTLVRSAKVCQERHGCKGQALDFQEYLRTRIRIATSAASDEATVCRFLLLEIFQDDSEDCTTGSQ